VLSIKGLKRVKHLYFAHFWGGIVSVHKQTKSLNIQDFHGNSPLHLSALKNNVDCTKLLIEKYACSIDLRNIDGIMAQHMGDWHQET